MKNFEEYFRTNESISDHIKKIFEAEGNFDIINNDLITEIREYLLTNYPSDWWNNEFQSRLDDYISQDDIVGSGDEDDESTWEYENSEDAYQNLCTGGAIEYDLLTEIREEIRKKFHISDEEYDRNNIGDIAEEHMCNMIDWYDHNIFGDNKVNYSDPFGISKKAREFMSRWDEISDDGNGNKL